MRYNYRHTNLGGPHISQKQPSWREGKKCDALGLYYNQFGCLSHGLLATVRQGYRTRFKENLT